MKSTLPKPARLEEWAYAGFAINLGSALSSPTSRWPMARRCGAGRRLPACSGGLQAAPPSGSERHQGTEPIEGAVL